MPSTYVIEMHDRRWVAPIPSAIRMLLYAIYPACRASSCTAADYSMMAFPLLFNITGITYVAYYRQSHDNNLEGDKI